MQTLSVRGTFVLNTFDFVCERYSAAAHAMVLQMLPASGTSLSAVREGFWTPLEDLVAYMETAKAVLAPGDRDFYRKMGFYGGSHVRALPVGIALSEQMRALRLYRMLWRTFFDAGDLEVIEACPEGAILRIRDFPSAAPFCQRLLGSVEGILSLAAMPVRVEERACTCRGDPYCEMLVTRGPSWQGDKRAGATCSDPYAARVLRAVRHLEQHLEESPSLAIVANVVGMGQFTLSRAFRSVMGMSFRTYLRQLRVAKGRQLLGNPRYSVTEIAQRVGYADLAHFDKVFRKLTGLSPTAYRRRAAG